MMRRSFYIYDDAVNAIYSSQQKERGNSIRYIKCRRNMYTPFSTNNFVQIMIKIRALSRTFFYCEANGEESTKSCVDITNSKNILKFIATDKQDKGFKNNSF